MIYCSFSGCITSKNGYNISGLYGSFFIRKNVNIFTQEYKTRIYELQKILKNIKIENKDYSKILDKTKKGDFVFLDPPYIEDKAYSFNYNKDEYFNPNELKKELEELDIKGVKWMMTQIDTQQVRHLFKKYKFKIYINKSNYGSAKTLKKELVITNY
jgi:DNA adenine methylase